MVNPKSNFEGEEERKSLLTLILDLNLGRMVEEWRFG